MPRARQDQEPRDGGDDRSARLGHRWDVFCWIGHRRFSRHWSIPQIRHELSDSYAIELTEPCIALYVQRDQTMLAARQQDFEAMRRQYEGVDDIILTIDGLQPEKGHETLYVVAN